MTTKEPTVSKSYEKSCRACGDRIRMVWNGQKWRPMQSGRLHRCEFEGSRSDDEWSDFLASNSEVASDSAVASDRCGESIGWPLIALIVVMFLAWYLQQLG